MGVRGDKRQLCWWFLLDGLGFSIDTFDDVPAFPTLAAAGEPPIALLKQPSDVPAKHSSSSRTFFFRLHTRMDFNNHVCKWNDDGRLTGTGCTPDLSAISQYFLPPRI